MAPPPRPNPLSATAEAGDLQWTPQGSLVAVSFREDDGDSDVADIREAVRRKICGRLAALFVTARDDKRTAELKLLLARECVVGIILVSFFVTFFYDKFVESMWLAISMVLSFMHVLVATGALFKDTTNRSLPMLMIIDALLVFSADMASVIRLGYPRTWPFYTLIFAVCTIFHVPRWTHIGVYCVVGLEIIICVLHQTMRFSMDPLHPADFIPAVCDCDAPPCPHQVFNSIYDFSFFGAILFFMASVLNNFAARVYAERRRLVAAIEVAEAVATNLSAFDLEATERLLAGTTADAGHDLPPKLHAALTHILDNLKLYRPYLPDELFHSSSEYRRSNCVGIGAVDRGDLDGVPGGADGLAAVVFTDIRQSTALWEHSGDAMRDALAQHNATIRTALATWRGYEVKTIGDAFMIAFHTAAEAVGFGVEVQNTFAQAVWPVGLTRPDADDGFALLSVRIGVHWGCVHVERNTLTGRYDYFGPTVNAAARVEAHGVPGVVTATHAVMEARVGGDEGVPAGVAEIPFAAARYGKGLADALWLTALVGREVPGVLVARVRELCEATPVGAEQGTRRASQNAEIVPPEEVLSVGEDEADSTSSVSKPPMPLGKSIVKSFGKSFGRSIRSQSTMLWSRNVRTGATVGMIKFAFGADMETSWDAMEGSIAQRLQQLHVHLQTTGGHVSTLVHNVALVSWGVYGQCPQYMNESVRCLMLLDEEYRSGPRSVSGCGFHAGLATGAVASGKVSATASQTLLTMLGPCVDVALALCGSAAEVGTAALVASVADVGMDRYECSALLRSHLRAVDVWDMGAGRREVAVYELRVGGPAAGGRGADDVLLPAGDTSCAGEETKREPADPQTWNLRDGRHLPHALACWMGAPMRAKEVMKTQRGLPKQGSRSFACSK